MKITFSLPPDVTISDKIVGEIIISNLNISEKLKKAIDDYNVVDLTIKPSIIFALPNGNLAISDKCKIFIYDKQFKNVKTIDTINDSNFELNSIASNYINRLYVTNNYTNQLMMTTLDFNYLKSCNAFRFDLPRGMCFYNDHLYVSDCGHDRIQKLNADLNFVHSYPLEFTPVDIKIDNNTVFIRSTADTSFYVFSLNTFTLKYKYDGHCGNLSQLFSNFYEYFPPDMKFFCYDQNGRFVEEIKTEGYDNLAVNTDDGNLVLFHGFILMSCCAEKKLIKM